MNNKNNKITTGTIVRTIVLALALINQILVNSGRDVLPIADQDVEIVVTTIITIGASLVAWWKNNSFTNPAIEADKYKDVLKAEENNEV